MGDAPDNAEYVVLTADPTLTAERILTGTATSAICATIRRAWAALGR